jgi:AcrR family transcriptional regulator
MPVTSDKREEAILDAVVYLLVELGFKQLTTDAVAARARVSKQTIYSRWPSKAELVVAAVRSLGGETVDLPDTGNLHDDVTTLLRSMRTQFLDTDFLSVPALLSASRRTDPELDAALSELSNHRRRPFVAVFERAIQRGELPPDADAEILADSIVGAVFLRHIFRRIDVDDATIETIVATVLGKS